MKVQYTIHPSFIDSTKNKKYMPDIVVNENRQALNFKKYFHLSTDIQKFTVGGIFNENWISSEKRDIK